MMDGQSLNGHPTCLAPDEEMSLANEGLSPNCSADTACQWLKANKFSAYVKVFSNFSGIDLLRLEKEDLIEICGITDGIRLFHALNQTQQVKPRLTLYLCQVTSRLYHAIYLETISLAELKDKVAEVFGIQQSQIDELCWKGPCGNVVKIENEVIYSFTDQECFALEFEQITDNTYRIMLESVKQTT